MNLLVDSGNSFIKSALGSEEELVIMKQCRSDAPDGLRGLWDNYDNPVRVLVANVAGDRVAEAIQDTVKTLWNLDAEFVTSSKSCCGLTSHYLIPGQLGVDRWMAMLSAFRMVPGPVVVVDCGTAVTIDLVDNNGTFLGGVIMPGLNTAFQSLRAGTDAVERIGSIASHTTSAALTTEEGVAAGVLYGLAGGIERVVSEQARLVGEVPIVFLTGGDAEAVLPHLTMPVNLQPDLVLEGLRIFSYE